MRILALTITLMIWTGSKEQTPIKDYVRHHTHPIRTISQDSLDFADLEPIGKAIGDKRIVMLGEQDHGDGPTFLAKTRLIKYLHEKKGFNVLVFEDDFFSLTQGYAELTGQKEKITSFLKNNIFPIWGYCDACKDLFADYLPAHSDMLKVVGIDCQMPFPYRQRYLRHRLDSVLQALDLPVTHEAAYKSTYLRMVDSLASIRWYEHAQKATLDSVAEWAGRAQEEARAKLPENDLCVQVLANVRDEAGEYALLHKNRRQASEIRDRRMAKNLAWFANEKYHGDKLIVWAANPHVAKRMDDPAMGGYFTEDSTFDKETYVIGFTGFKGEGGRLGFKPYAIDPPSSECFESWIDPSLQNAFVDLDGLNSQNPRDDPRFHLRFWNYREEKNTWSHIFNGMFFIRENRPCVLWK